MKIAGIQKLSLVDFPGYISAVIFTYGCNFRCGYCQNPDLVNPDPGFVSCEREVFEYLISRKDFIEGVVITGGEPTIYKDLPDLIRKLKKYGFKVKLDTNGSNPGQLKELLDSEELDYVSVDIKTSFSKYDEVAKMKGSSGPVKESAKLVMSSNVPYEFRTTCVPGIITEEDIRKIGKAVKGAKKCSLQQFRAQITLDKSFEQVKPFPPKTLKSFQTILKESAEEVEIRGI